MKNILLLSAALVLLVLIAVFVVRNITKKPSSETTFCGGIANIACQSGFSCTLDGSYPDAGGRCVRK